MSQDPVGIGPLETTTNSAKVGRLGQLVFPYNDGRGFRLMKSSAAIAAAKMIASAAEVANHSDMAVAAASAIDASTATVTLGGTAATANQYADGYLEIIDAAGEGQMLRIRSHPAAVASASLVVTLQDKPRVALTTSSKATLRYHECADVVLAPADGIDAPMGVSLVAVDAADTYFLGQVSGRCLCLATGTTVQGDPCGVVTTAGALGALAESGSGAYDRTDAIASQAAATTEYGSFDLRLGF